MTFYTGAQRDLQEEFGQEDLADKLAQSIVLDHMDDAHVDFIEGRDYFFLSTVDGDGMPTVSYKGGAPGFVSVLDANTLAFPHYDGNGMYLSAGNIIETGRVGLLFIDFETPRRVRIQGIASATTDDPLMDRYPGASMVVRVSVTNAFRNCGRYIHPHQRESTSGHVPDADGSQPVPLWKRIDLLQGAVGAEVSAKVEQSGGTITAEEYAARMMKGES